MSVLDKIKSEINRIQIKRHKGQRKMVARHDMDDYILFLGKNEYKEIVETYSSFLSIKYSDIDKVCDDIEILGLKIATFPCKKSYLKIYKIDDI